jgi:hypothetical protein
MSTYIELLYNEFGENVKHLGLNLRDLQKIIECIGTNGMTQHLDSVYFNSLCDIIGDYQRTLQDCDNLLRDRAKFRWRGDFIHNIIWNYTVASDIQGLKDRLAYLNIKILTMLKTLDLGMAQQLSINIFRIHRDLASRIDAARDDIIQQIATLRLEVQGVLTGSPNAMASSSTAQTGHFDIPASLKDLFRKHIEAFDFDSSQLPLVRGLDAAVYHIHAATKIPADTRESKRERKWLEIAKAFWIITELRCGQEYVPPTCYISSSLASELRSVQIPEAEHRSWDE